jgi:hypothetical protein
VFIWLYQILNSERNVLLYFKVFIILTFKMPCEIFIFIFLLHSFKSGRSVAIYFIVFMYYFYI